MSPSPVNFISRNQADILNGQQKERRINNMINQRTVVSLYRLIVENKYSKI